MDEIQTSATTYEAAIPLQPDGLQIVTDRDGDVWQRDEGRWVCTKAKLQGLLGGVRETQWRHLVVALGPLTAIHWAAEPVTEG